MNEPANPAPPVPADAVAAGTAALLADPPGWYGKLPALGDFASRRLPAEWVQRCDDWLSDCMSRSRAELGTDWLDLYLTAPLWRFAWAPGVIDPQWWFGVLMPSCDKVGRYFPLVLAQAGSQVPTHPDQLVQLEGWYRHVAGTALQTLAGHGSVEDFEAALAQAPSLPGDAPAGVAVAAPAGSCAPMQRDETLAGWLARAAGVALQQQLQGCSLWWSWLPDEPSGPVRVLTGLPGPEQFSAMLDGRW